METLKTRITVNRLHPLFVAEVTGNDLKAPLSREDFNGRKALYVGAHAQEIVGMPPREGRRILDELTAFCTQPQFVYSHSWRDGDAVMWDNRCTLHRATTYDKTRYKRKLHRTTIAGKAPDTAFATMP